MHESAETKSAWTRYWDEGHIESLPEDRAAGLLAGFDSAWRQFFAGFPARAKLLDLATGGGDVIRRAIALRRAFDITGIDLADLSAVRASLPVSGVTLIGNAGLSSLPFANAQFDGVTSQFGIEYSDVPASAREAVRVLVPGGRGRFVLHHAGSAITHGVAANIAADRSVLADRRAFQCGRTVFELIEGSGAPAVIADAEAEFREAVDALASRLKNDRAFGPARNVVAFLSRLATAPGSHPPAESLHQLALVEQQIAARTLRKQAQLDAALDRNGVETLAGCLTQAGATVDSPKELKYPGGRILGWAISFNK